MLLIRRLASFYTLIKRRHPLSELIRRQPDLRQHAIDVGHRGPRVDTALEIVAESTVVVDT